MNEEAEKLLEELADETQWEKNEGGYWVFSGAVPFVNAQAALALLSEKPTCQTDAAEFRQKVTCALLDCRSDGQQLKVALELLHEAEDHIEKLLQ